MPGRGAISDTSPSSTSAAISGTTLSAAMSTQGARFSKRRALTAANSPPPVTSGGLPSKLTRMGKVRIRLSSHHQPFDWCIGQALGRELDLQPVKLLRHDDLAAKPRALVDIERAVEHLELLRGRRRKLRQPIFCHPDMAGGAGASPAALRFDRKAPVADHLHDAPALKRLEAMRRAVGHMHGDEHGLGGPQ